MAKRKLTPFRVLVAAMLAIILAIFAVAVVRTRVAHAADMAIDALSLMTRRHGSSPAAESLVVNGLTFEITSGSARAPLRRVLDDFSARCPKTETILGKVAFPVSEVLSRFPGRSREAAVRFEGDGRGLIACLVPEGDPTPSIGERLTAFAKTLDLSLFGRVQLVIAASAGETTSYAVLRSKGSLPLRSAFPPGGDAPGGDPEALSRLPNSVRLLSASTDGATPSIVVYETTRGAPVEPTAHYLQALSGQQWTVVSSLQRSNRVVARKGGRVTVVSVSTDEERVFTTVVTL